MIEQRYQDLINVANLLPEETESIFAALENNIDTDNNKERLFNAYFKSIYRFAIRALNMGRHDNLDEIISFLTKYFYDSIDNYDPNNSFGASFNTYILSCLGYAEKSVWKLRSSLPLTTQLPDESGLGEMDDENLLNVQDKKKLRQFEEEYASGVNIISQVEKFDCIGEIERFVRESSKISDKERETFFEMYSFDGDFKVGNLRDVAKKVGVSHEMVRLRTNKVKDRIKLFLEDKDFSFSF